MGDRRNIVVHDEKGANPIFFYSHYDGNKLAEVLYDALERGQDRWSDAPYLNRIIFSQMIKDAGDNLTGFGISASLTDSNYTHELEVFHKEQKVSVGEGNEFSFNEFIELSYDELREL